MRVVVTGGAGFLGTHVIEHLSKSGIEVFSLDIRGGPKVATVDITTKVEVEGMLEWFKPDAVIHLAALAGATGKGGGAESLKAPYGFIRVNALGTLNLFESCREFGISKIIIMSSFSPYGKAICPIDEDTPLRPNNPYGASKAMVEEVAKIYALCYGIKTVIFRVPLICGEGQRELNALREFVQSAIKDEPIVLWGDGSTLREFVHPLDVAEAYKVALGYLAEMDKPYDLFVLGNSPISMGELAGKIIKKVGKGRVQFLPDKPKLYDQFTRRSHVEETLGWLPSINIDEIIDRVVKEVKA